MDTVIKIIGIVILLMGLLYIAYPGVMLWLIEFFKKGYRIYVAAVIRFVLGIIFLLGARECSVTWLIIVFGILFLFGGLLILLLGRERTTAFLNYYGTRPIWLLRILAAIALIIGGIIIYAA
jgi:hypothetical protein